MELGGGGRRGDGVRRQVQSVGRLAAYLAGGFLLLSAASSVAVRSLRALSDANQRKFATPCGACEGKGTYACRLCRGSAAIEWSPMRDPVFINPCLCPTCDGTRVQRCLNCLGKGREIAAPTQNEGSIGECAICRLCFMWEGISHMCQKYILSFEA